MYGHRRRRKYSPKEVESWRRIQDLCSPSFKTPQLGVSLKYICERGSTQASAAMRTLETISPESLLPKLSYKTNDPVMIAITRLAPILATIPYPYDPAAFPPLFAGAPAATLLGPTFCRLRVKHPFRLDRQLRCRCVVQGGFQTPWHLGSALDGQPSRNYVLISWQ